MSTLEQWLNNSTQKLMAELPGHSFESAKSRVETWLTAEGGWNLDEGETSGGEGSPPNEETPQQAVSIIVTEDITKISSIIVRPTVVLELSMTENFETGTTDQEKINIVESFITDRITNALDSAPGIRTISFSFPNSPYNEREGGELDVSERLAVQAEITNQPTLITSTAIATAHIRAINESDNKWVCDREFTLANSVSPIFLRVRKYTNTSYSTLDDVGYHFIVSLDRETLSVNTITKL